MNKKYIVKASGNKFEPSLFLLDVPAATFISPSLFSQVSFQEA